MSNVSVPRHPRRQPRLAGELTVEELGRVFSACVDYQTRTVAVGGSRGARVTLAFLAGMVAAQRLDDSVLRPLARDRELAGLSPAALGERLAAGGLCALSVARVATLDQGAADLVGGKCLLFLPGGAGALSIDAGSEEKRGVSPPENEVSVKGPRDSFVESLRTNTALVRRHLKAPELKIAEEIVGRQSLTAVDVLWLEGIADPRLVEAVVERLRRIDLDALLSTGNMEEYLVDQSGTAFPLLLTTERPDRFCRGLDEGRVGVLADGLPVGILAPGVLGDLLRAPQDRAENWMVASVLTCLRWACLLVTLYLPGVYVAMVNFHPEMIPTRLALSIMAARQDVPFSALFEILLLLASFEVLQEAGLRLPQPVGQTVSILGGLVVGSAAVEARLISPAVLVVVAMAGVAGYTMPSQDLAGALRLWRFALAALGGLAGLFGVVAGTALLAGHLAGLESFGVAYLSGGSLLRRPLPQDKLRPAHLSTPNRRAQG